MKPWPSRALLLSAGIAFVAFLGAGSSRAEAPVEPPAFQGSASATGVNINLTLPGAPLSDTLVDVGGPVAEVASSSIGSGNAYAAFPFPGPLVQSAPGVITGLLGQGAGGLPPIKLPAPPAYPFLVSADPASPNATLGAGPYSLAAHSNGYSADATATGGIESGAAGNASLLKATAILTATSTAVVSTATSDAQALTVGPLTIGEVTATATMTLHAGAAPLPTDRLEIDGLKVGGIPVAINTGGLDVAGVAVPVPINATLAALLKSSGTSIELLPAREIKGGVIAPALQITTAVSGSAVGAGKGTMTIIVGGATASLGGAAAGGGALPSAPPASSPETGSVVGGEASGPTGGSVAATRNVAADAATGGNPTVGGDGPLPATAPVRTSALVGQFDIRSMYLLFALLAGAVWLAGQLIRILGVRDRWTSTGG